MVCDVSAGCERKRGGRPIPVRVPNSGGAGDDREEGAGGGEGGEGREQGALAQSAEGLGRPPSAARASLPSWTLPPTPLWSLYDAPLYKTSRCVR